MPREPKSSKAKNKEEVIVEEKLSKSMTQYGKTIAKVESLDNKKVVKNRKGSQRRVSAKETVKIESNQVTSELEDKAVNTLESGNVKAEIKEHLKVLLSHK